MDVMVKLPDKKLVGASDDCSLKVQVTANVAETGQLVSGYLTLPIMLPVIEIKVTQTSFCVIKK